MPEEWNLLQLVSDSLERYLDGARQQECPEEDSAEAILEVASRHARDILGKRRTLSVVGKVMDEDDRIEPFPIERPVLFSPDSPADLARLVAIKDDGTVDLGEMSMLRRLIKHSHIIKVAKDR